MNEIINDDCRNVMSIMKDNSIDLIYADILYGTGKNFSNFTDIKRERAIVESFYTPIFSDTKRILKSTGSIYIQMDYRINHWVREILDDVFGYNNIINEIIWFYKTGGSSKRFFSRKHDTIYLYVKTKDYKFNKQKEKSYLSHKYGFSNIEIKQDERGYYTEVGIRDVWDIPALRGNQPEVTGYPTQKPEKLLERIILSSSNVGDIIFDPFCGSGTSCKVAKDLGRKYIGCDISSYACEIARDRLI